MRITIRHGVSLLVALSLAACDRPSPVVPNLPAPVTPAPSAPPLAFVVIGVTFAGIHQDYSLYYPHVVLREISGAGAATIQYVRVASVTGDAVEVKHDSCFRSRVVQPGQTWSLETGAIGYCAELWTRAELEGRALTATVGFVDDGGRPGTVHATVTVPR